MMNEVMEHSTLASLSLSYFSNRIHLPSSLPVSESKQSPNVTRVIQLFEKHRERTLNEWTEVQVQRNEYEDLKSLLKTPNTLFNYVNDQVRFDYDPCRALLAIRMAGFVHDSLANSICMDIVRQLIKIEDHTDLAADLVKGIHFDNSLILELEDGATRYPDFQFGYKNNQYPAIIVEISDTQSQKDLKFLADHYIVQSTGSVNVVIGIKLDYEKTHKATISIWRPHLIEENNGKAYLTTREVVSSEIFRKENGVAVQGKSLVIPVKDFLPSNLANGIHDEVTIKYSKLAEYLDNAETRKQVRKSGQGWREPMPAGVTKRVLERSPPEELTAADERHFQLMEDKDERRAEGGRDTDW